MKTKLIIHKDKNNKYKLLNLNKTIANFISSINILNNDIKKDYKFSFIHKSFVNEYKSKSNKNNRLFTNSYSKRNGYCKIKEKINNNDSEKIFNLEKIGSNKNTINQKYKFIKKTILKNIKEGKNPFIINNNEEKYNKNNKNTNIIKFHEYNTTRCPLANNTNQKNIYDKNINIKNNIKTKISNNNTLDVNRDSKKKKLRKKISKLISSTKKQNNINDSQKLKKSENKKIKKFKLIPDLIISDNDINLINKGKTFIETDTYSNLNNFHKYKTIKKETKTIINKTNNNKKIFVRNHKDNISNFYKDKNYTNKYKVASAFNSKKEIKIIPNNLEKSKKNIISKKNSLKIVKENENERNKKVKQINKKKFENNINIMSEKKNKHINNMIDDEELDNILNIESEHKSTINLIKINNFDVNKPRESNMKYTLLKENEDEEENKNINNSKIENIIIGKIEGYKDIMDSDELNKKTHLRSISSFNINKQTTKNKINTVKSKNMKDLKAFPKNKTSFINFNILDDNSSEIEDLDFDYNDFRINNQLINIENGYEFEDMPTNENETKLNNNLLPFQVSKISFCKYYDKNDGKYKINENIDTDIISLVQINKDSNKLNDNKNKKKTNLKNHINKKLKDNTYNINKRPNNNKNNIKIYTKKKIIPYRNNYKRTKINENTINKSNKKDKNYILKNNLKTENNMDCNLNKKKINRINHSKKINNLKYINTIKDINIINNKDKKYDLKIVSIYGNKDNCLIF